MSLESNRLVKSWLERAVKGWEVCEGSQPLHTRRTEEELVSALNAPGATWDWSKVPQMWEVVLDFL